MLKWKRVCHTLEAFYFCQIGIFFFAAYKGRVLTYKGEATPSGMKLDVNVTMPTMGLAGTSWNLASLDKE